MIFYYYDGSFEGLLTAIYEAYYRRESPTIMPEEKNIQMQLFSTNVKLKLQRKRHQRYMMQYIKNFL